MPRERKAWFAPRSFGYGYTPISWEGWVLTLVFTVATVGAVAVLRQSPLLMIGVLVAATAGFMWLANRHLDGELAWRWNGRKWP